MGRAQEASEVSSRSSPNAGQLYSAQAFAQQVRDARVSKLVVLAQIDEHHPDLTLAKAEASQGREEFSRDIERLGLQRLAAFGAVRMPEAKAHVGVPFDDERPTMRRPVMSSADGHEVREFVGAAFGAQVDVMQVFRQTCQDRFAHCVRRRFERTGLPVVGAVFNSRRRKCNPASLTRGRAT
jgi:hypothetical protein